VRPERGVVDECCREPYTVGKVLHIRNPHDLHTDGWMSDANVTHLVEEPSIDPID